jgi:hypothetical protein
MIGEHGLEFDTVEWQQLRNQKLQEWIGDPYAIAFILAFADACELFDDMIDKDKPVEDAHVIRVLFSLITELPLNPFFDAYKAQLIPILVTGINAWLDSNELEKGDENEQVFAYVLRDWYMEFVSFVIYLVRGRDYMREVSMDVRYFFTHHETLEAFREKLK